MRLSPSKNANSELTRIHIIKTASKLFLKKSYDRTSIRDIARACEMAMGSLYYHIGNKENLLRLVVEFHGEKTGRIIESLLEAKRKYAPLEALKKSVDFFFQTIDKNKELFVFVYTEAKVMPKDIRQGLLETERQVVRAFEEILSEARKAGLIYSDNLTLSAHSIVSLVQMWGVKWWYLKDLYSPDQYKDFVVNFALKSLQV